MLKNIRLNAFFVLLEDTKSKNLILLRFLVSSGHLKMFFRVCDSVNIQQRSLSIFASSIFFSSRNLNFHSTQENFLSEHSIFGSITSGLNSRISSKRLFHRISHFKDSFLCELYK